MSIKYYLYKITNLINNKFYIGVHSTEDINDGYMGSGKAIKAAEKKYGINNFKKEILEYFDSIEEMYKREAEIVNESLIQNPLCYNITLGGYGLSKKGYCYVEDQNHNRLLISKNDPGLKNGTYFKLILYRDKNNNIIQTTKLDKRVQNNELIPINTGLVSVKDKYGNFYKVFKDDPRYLSGELFHNCKNCVTVRDKNGNTFQVDKNNEKYLSGEYQHVSKGKITVKDKNGNTFSTTINDPKYLSGEYKHIATHRAVVKDKEGNIKTIDIDNEDYKNGKYISILKNKVPVKDKNNNCFIVDINNEDYKNGKLIPLSTGYAMMKDNNDNIIRVSKDKIDNNLRGITKGMVVAKDNENNIHFIPVNDEKYLTKEYKHINTNMVPVIDKYGNKIQITKEEYDTNKEKYRHPLKGRITVRDKNGNTFSVFKDDLRLKTGELIGITKGMIPCCNKDNFDDRKLLSKDDSLYKIQYIPISSLRIKVKDNKGNIFKTYKNDPRLINGLLQKI